MLDKRTILWTAVTVVAGAAAAIDAVAASGADAAPPLEQTREGVRVAGDLVPGSTLIRSYEPYAGDATTVRGEDRTTNRATVARFFALPIGAERAQLYATDGVKQLPALGIQWPGLDAQLKNNEQNRGRYPGWSWSEVVIWNTEDPTVFWVEANGATAPGAQPAYANHYVMQFVVRGGRIVLFREFGTPVRTTPVPTTPPRGKHGSP
jgi:ketosteroid isomerase-like protein